VQSLNTHYTDAVQYCYHEVAKHAHEQACVEGKVQCHLRHIYHMLTETAEFNKQYNQTITHNNSTERWCFGVKMYQNPFPISYRSFPFLAFLLLAKRGQNPLLLHVTNLTLKKS